MILLCACSSVRIERRFPKPTPKSNQLPAKQEVTDSVDSITAKSLAKILQNCPDLNLIVEAWPDLPEAVKVGIAAMVKAALPEINTYKKSKRKN